MILILEGITQKGKNRINEQGFHWEVVDTVNDKMLLKALNTGYLKWGPEPDFKVVEMK